MVLDQKQTPTTHVDKRQVIDGQQRLTTLQIFLSAFRDFCRQQECEELAKECDSYTLNKGMMSNPEVEKFKVWPTQLDRGQFKDVISAGSPEELIKLHPLVTPKYARKPLPRPRMIEAYLFFYSQLEAFFLGTEAEPPLAQEFPLSTRLEECFQALKNALQVVAIDLEQGDDAQVIFETLNARGEPLLPADLLRNYIFLRASRHGESSETLYEEHWRRFDSPFWRVEIKQGRLSRPRSDLFIQHFLASRLTRDIAIKHLFVEYKFWIERSKPFATVEAELATLARQGNDFRRISEPKVADVLYPLATFLDAFDIGTSYPLLLALLDAKVSDTEWQEISATLESYLLRRAVCGLTTKAYNRVFLTLTRVLRRDGFTQKNLADHLMGLMGESGEWPSDAAFSEAWRTSHAYQTLSNPKIVHILKRLNTTYFGSKMEEVSVQSALTVEHILPQSWVEHWHLADGSRGMTQTQLWNADAGDEQALATRKRNRVLQTFGNLTLLSQASNSSTSNSNWTTKRPAILSHSLLPINQQLSNVDVWDEEAIAKRGEELLMRALKLWPRA